MSRLNSTRELEHLREQLREQRRNITTTVMVCGGTGCQASRSQTVIDAVRDELSDIYFQFDILRHDCRRV